MVEVVQVSQRLGHVVWNLMASALLIIKHIGLNPISQPSGSEISLHGVVVAVVVVVLV